jgi:hypothetical protein
VSPPVAHQEWAWKHPLHRRENFHHRGAVKQPEQQDLCSNICYTKVHSSQIFHVKDLYRNTTPIYRCIWTQSVCMHTKTQVPLQDSSSNFMLGNFIHKCLKISVFVRK